MFPDSKWTAPALKHKTQEMTGRQAERLGSWYCSLLKIWLKKSFKDECFWCGKVIETKGTQLQAAWIQRFLYTEQGDNILDNPSKVSNNTFMHTRLQLGPSGRKLIGSQKRRPLFIPSTETTLKNWEKKRNRWTYVIASHESRKQWCMVEKCLISNI